MPAGVDGRVGPSGRRCTTSRFERRERTPEHLDSSAILPDGVVGASKVAERQVLEGRVVQPRGDIQGLLTAANSLILLAHLPEQIG